MENQELNTRIEAQNTEVDNNQYIEAINEMRRNSVDRSEYDKLRDENKKLLKSLINGESISNPVQENKRTEAEIRNELFTKDLNNLDFIKDALELRQTVLDNTGKDIFVADGINISPTGEDYACAQKVAEALQECVDYADGNSQVFTAELQRITKDVRLR